MRERAGLARKRSVNILFRGRLPRPKILNRRCREHQKTANERLRCRNLIEEHSSENHTVGKHQRTDDQNSFRLQSTKRREHQEMGKRRKKDTQKQKAPRVLEDRFRICRKPCKKEKQADANQLIEARRATRPTAPQSSAKKWSPMGAM